MKVVWLSAGVSSFIAGYLVKETVDEWIYIDIADQHPDSLRFIHDCEKAIETPVQKTTFKDLRGCRFGKLTVIDFAEPQHRRKNDRAKYFYCICDCGKETIVNGRNLRSGSCKSCGCNSGRKNKNVS